MKAVRTICGEFQQEDIYDMDEIGLFWRQSPKLSTQSQPGRRRDKSRVSLVICCNCTGSDRLPLWIIGRTKAPHALRRVNLSAMGCIWRSNTSAWMTTIIMEQ